MIKIMHTTFIGKKDLYDFFVYMYSPPNTILHIK